MYIANSIWPLANKYKVLVAISMVFWMLLAQNALVAEASSMDEYMLYSTSGTDIRVIPLSTTGLPNLSGGTAVTASAYCASDPERTAQSKILPLAGEWITVWTDYTNEESCYSRFSANDNGGYDETQLGEWPYRWWIVGVEDLDGDGDDDLVMGNREDNSAHTYRYRVALGQPDGSFDMSSDPVIYVPQTWVAKATLADADGDGYSDFVYYAFATGSSHETVIHMHQGNGNGTFNTNPLPVFTSPHGAENISFGDFNGDNYDDIYLSVDDDVQDMGQSHIAINDGSYDYTLQVSIDFRPDNELPTNSAFFARVFTYDVNQDGHLDLVAGQAESTSGPSIVEVYWGDGTGNFATPGEILLSGYNWNDSDRPRVEFGPLCPPTDNSAIYVSSSTGGTVDGIRFADEDILTFDPSTNSWSMYFDGSDVGLSKWDVNAFHVLDNGDILMSFNWPKTIANLKYDDSDIVRFTGSSWGTNTAGSFSMYLDGSTVGLTTGGEDIDAISFTSGGELVISTLGRAKVNSDPILRTRGEDLLRLDAGGTWGLYFDGSNVGLNARDEGIWAAWIDSDTDEFHLSTQGNYDIPKLLTGDSDDVFICVPDSLKPVANYKFNLFWDGDLHGYGAEKIDGYAVGPLPMLLVSSASVNGSEIDEAPEENDTADDDVLEEDEITTEVYLPVIKQ